MEGKRKGAVREAKPGLGAKPSGLRGFKQPDGAAGKSGGGSRRRSARGARTETHTIPEDADSPPELPPGALSSEGKLKAKAKGLDGHAGPAPPPAKRKADPPPLGTTRPPKSPKKGVVHARDGTPPGSPRSPRSSGASHGGSPGSPGVGSPRERERQNYMIAMELIEKEKDTKVEIETPGSQLHKVAERTMRFLSDLGQRMGIPAAVYKQLLPSLQHMSFMLLCIRPPEFVDVNDGTLAATMIAVCSEVEAVDAAKYAVGRVSELTGIREDLLKDFVLNVRKSVLGYGERRHRALRIRELTEKVGHPAAAGLAGDGGNGRSLGGSPASSPRRPSPAEKDDSPKSPEMLQLRSTVQQQQARLRDLEAEHSHRREELQQEYHDRAAALREEYEGKLTHLESEHAGRHGNLRAKIALNEERERQLAHEARLRKREAAAKEAHENASAQLMASALESLRAEQLQVRHRGAELIAEMNNAAVDLECHDSEEEGAGGAPPQTGEASEGEPSLAVASEGEPSLAAASEGEPSLAAGEGWGGGGGDGSGSGSGDDEGSDDGPEVFMVPAPEAASSKAAGRGGIAISLAKEERPGGSEDDVFDDGPDSPRPDSPRAPPVDSDSDGFELSSAGVGARPVDVPKARGGGATDAGAGTGAGAGGSSTPRVGGWGKGLALVGDGDGDGASLRGGGGAAITKKLPNSWRAVGLPSVSSFNDWLMPTADQLHGAFEAAKGLHDSISPRNFTGAGGGASGDGAGSGGEDAGGA